MYVNKSDIYFPIVHVSSIFRVVFKKEKYING